MLLKTNIKADERSTETGVIYPRSELSKLMGAEYAVPGAFNVHINTCSLENTLDWITAKRQFTLIGFDLINDWLYVRIEPSGEESAERMETHDFKISLLVEADYADQAGGKMATNIREVRGITLEDIDV